MQDRYRINPAPQNIPPKVALLVAGIPNHVIITMQVVNSVTGDNVVTTRVALNPAEASDHARRCILAAEAADLDVVRTDRHLTTLEHDAIEGWAAALYLLDIGDAADWWKDATDREKSDYRTKAAARLQIAQYER